MATTRVCVGRERSIGIPLRFPVPRAEPEAVAGAGEGGRSQANTLANDVFRRGTIERENASLLRRRRSTTVLRLVR